MEREATNKEIAQPDLIVVLLDLDQALILEVKVHQEGEAAEGIGIGRVVTVVEITSIERVAARAVVHLSTVAAEEELVVQ